MAATTTAFEAELVAATTGVNERQQVAMGGTVTGGTFTLTFAGATTDPIAYNATAAQVRVALEALPTLEIGDIDCSGGPLPGAVVLIDFVGTKSASDQPQVTATGTGLTGTAPTVTGSTTQASTARAYTLTQRGLMAGAVYRLRSLYQAGVTDPTAHAMAKSNPAQLAALTANGKLASFDAITAV